MTSIPSGTVTFLFTDIEGSTKLARAHPETWEAARTQHHAILREAIERHDGFVFQVIGDAFCAAFHKAGDALKAAIKIQQDLQNEPWGEVTIYVRMGIHTGEAEFDGNDYRGYTTLSFVQRLMSAGHGGQILVSSTIENLLREQLLGPISLRGMGMQKFAGMSSPMRIFQVIAPDLPTEFPPLRTLDNLPNNLPIQLTSFVGREKELADVRKFLLYTRILTLIGPGGTGKTRLSIQAANEMLHQYPDGVWFIELAPILDPLLVPHKTANMMGLREEPQRPVIDVLCDYLHEKQILLVLDNCEHLVDACARMADQILHGAPDTRILASSREALGIGGEVTYRVPSLGLPDIQHLPPIEALNQYEAVKLFIERATSAVPTFTVTNENAPALAQVCYHLDGIPLAIELAAAKIRVLSVEQIAKRLDDRFKLLTSGNRTALERHQTLRAAIDWSYNLLSPAEQLLFQRLAVFVGGGSLEAAESVCEGGLIKNDDVLNLLEQLINKSLVIKEEAEHESRYHMLETIRQYAHEKLFESGEVDSVRQKHGEWFLAAAYRADLEYLSWQNEISLFDKFKNDHENFRTALDRLLATEQFENYGRLASALGMFWFRLGYYQEGRHRLDVGLMHREQLSKIVIAKTLRALSRILARTGIYELAITCGEESVTLFRELDDKTELAWALDCFSSVLDESGNEERMLFFENEALILYRELGNKIGMSDMMIEIGKGQVTAGNFIDGFATLEESLNLKRDLGEAFGIAYSLFVLSTCRWRSQEYVKSELAAKEALRLFHQLGDRWFSNGCLTVLAGVSSVRHQPQQAAQYIGVIDKILETIRGSPPLRWVRDVYNPILLSIHEQLNDVDYDKAYNQGYSMTLEQAIALALEARQN